MGEYRLTPAAERDLEGVWQYSQEQWGSDQADRYTDSLIAAFESLAGSPQSAPACNHIRPGYRRLGSGQHMIYFRVDERGIIIVRILHDHMDAARHL